ncbi:glycosyl hydrolase family 35 [Kribbella amoyensis]|uniref:Glycosyl hydrolase family 35 n=1 Tax=Kribbella amoyensis TaxID=996641 RepID=A0A561BUQ5_9ACTN|nr:beta-galactosidase [Kribbella amoyensis]TWD82578.1 glycosyl hydrolase family 35 [Kribbella amoyensis]
MSGAVRTHSVKVGAPEPALTGHLRLGGRSKSGSEISVDSRSLWRDGTPWFPVMGEFHYSRYPRAEWESELRKIKAGGITIVGAYVFWILHEERKGVYRWDGDRDLRRFVELCHQVGLEVVARIGPWGHGEARNGAFPDWLMDLDLEARTDDPRYLAIVRPWYSEIARQLEGLFWLDGGPVVAVQIENELYDQPEHLRTLKRMAKDVGFDVPIWTVTGWGRADIPRDEFIPLFGGYPEAAWDEHDAGWAKQSRLHFFFTHVRDDFTIGSDLRQEGGSAADSMADTGGGGAIGGNTEGATGPELERYPFATCELGGGMYTAYHRRPRIAADDIAAISLVKLGSGSTWQGYYMYHGGTQVIGELSTTQESHATGYPNDLPLLTYDFQAPLSEYGQVRPSFAALRQHATWIAAEGSKLARMVTTLPDDAPTDPENRAALRWAVRSDGDSGYLFVNNHQPVEHLAEQAGIRFEVAGLGADAITIPTAGCDIPSGAYFAWPLRLDISGARLSASAQVVARTQVGDRDALVLAAVDGSPIELQVEGGSVRDLPEGASVRERSGLVTVTQLTAGLDCKVTIAGPQGATDVYVLAAPDRLCVSVVDREVYRSADPVVSFSGGPRVVTTSERVTVHQLTDEGWRGIELQGASADQVVASRAVRSAGPPRDIPRGGSLGRASAPVDEDFAAAAEWHLDTSELAAFVDNDEHDGDVLLRIDYLGDVARLYAGDRLLADHFWYGPAWEVGLDRLGREVLRDGLRLLVLPLAEGPPIYLSPGEVPHYESGVALDLRGVTAFRRVTVPVA